MFESYFFDKHSAIKFRLFQTLKSLNGEGFTVNKLSKTMSMSYQQTYNSFQDVMADLESMQGKASNRAKGKKDEKENDFAALAKTVHVDTYRFYLLQQSVTFSFFNTLFQNDGIDSAKFCKDENISASTLRRRIEPFREFLQEKQIRFDPTTWKLQGTEFQIRMLLNSFYTEAFRGAGWPFTGIDEKFVESALRTIDDRAAEIGWPKVPYASKQLLVDLAIQLLRISQHEYFIVNPRLQNLMRHFRDYTDPTKPLDHLYFTKTNFPHLVDRVLDSERDYYFFTRASLLTSGVNDNQVDRILRGFFRSFDNPVTDFVDQMIATLTKNLAPSSSMHVQYDKHLQSNLYRISYTFYVLDGSFVKNSDFADSAEIMAGGKPLYKQISEFVRDLPTDSEARVFTRFLPDIARSIFFTLVPDLSDFKTAPLLTVRIENENQSFISRDIFHYLSSQSVIRVLPDDSDELADVIITSAPNVSQMAAEMAGAKLDWKRTPTIIYWGNENQDSDLYRLMVELETLAAAKVPDD